MKLTSAANIQSMLLATVVALLVWVFAEGESLSSRSLIVTVSFPVEPTSPIMIRPEDPNFKGQVRVRLEGTTRTLDTAASVVNARGPGGTAGIRVIPGSPGVPTEPGEKKVVDLREVIASIPEFQGLGSTVAEVEPKQVVVNVVKMAALDVPVRVEFAAGTTLPTLDGEPDPSQKTVTLRLPEPIRNELVQKAGAAAVVTIGESELLRIRGLGEGPQTVTGSVGLPAEAGSIESFVVSPENMGVTLRVKRKVETMPLASVPVWYALPPTEDAGRWTITIEKKFITGAVTAGTTAPAGVLISGPAEELAKLKAGQIGVKAMIELTTEDLEKGASTGQPISKTATFPGLPPGVTVSAPDLNVPVRVARRA